MKRFIIFALLLATSAFAQSNVQFMRLENKAQGFTSAPEFNPYAGATLSQAFVGEASDFNLNFGLAGKLVLNYVKVSSAHVILFGNIAPPISARSATAFDAVSFANDGIGLGISPYFILGDLGLKSLTAVLEAGAKNNNFGEVNVWTYRLSGGLDGSLFVPGLVSPLNLSARATYVVVREAEFNRVQAEVEGNYWVFDANFILPLKDKLGLLFQGETTLETAPIFRVGLVLGTSI